MKEALNETDSTTRQNDLYLRVITGPFTFFSFAQIKELEWRLIERG